MDAKIRKTRDELRISGKALIVFGIWSILRLVFYNIMDKKSLQDYIFKATGASDTGSFKVWFTITIILLVIDLVFRIYIGCSAVSEGKGKKKSIVYIVLAFIYVFISVIGDAGYLKTLTLQDFSLAAFSAFFIDATSCIALIVIIVSSISLRIRMKQISN